MPLNIQHSTLSIWFIRWAFERLYREFAWAYDIVAAAVSGGLWRDWAQASLPFVRGRVLELGCGPGHLQLALAARGELALGVDRSPQMIAISRRRLRRAGFAPRVVQACAQYLPVPPASFDTVLATFPAEYITDPSTHAEIGRVLAPGGRIVVLPLAQLDRGFYAALIGLAYRLIGQASTEASQPAGRAAPIYVGGVVLEPHWVRVGPSQALVLVGDLGEG